MADVDYGYGDSAPDNAVDYGYGDPQPDYGYGDTKTDYGYGDDNAKTDYGYGDSQPDYGYGGDTKTDYGYDAPQTDYGYGDQEPQPAPAAVRKPKRRCSVTKYSLVSAGPEPVKPVEPDYGYGETTQAEYVEDRSTPLTADTSATDHEEPERLERHAKAEKQIKKGMMSKVRKRLSIF